MRLEKRCRRAVWRAKHENHIKLINMDDDQEVLLALRSAISAADPGGGRLSAPRGLNKNPSGSAMSGRANIVAARERINQLESADRARRGKGGAPTFPARRVLCNLVASFAFDLSWTKAGPKLYAGISIIGPSPRGLPAEGSLISNLGALKSMRRIRGRKIASASTLNELAVDFNRCTGAIIAQRRLSGRWISGKWAPRPRLSLLPSPSAKPVSGAKPTGERRENPLPVDADELSRSSRAPGSGPRCDSN